MASNLAGIRLIAKFFLTRNFQNSPTIKKKWFLLVPNKYNGGKIINLSKVLGENKKNKDYACIIVIKKNLSFFNEKNYQIHLKIMAQNFI